MHHQHGPIGPAEHWALSDPAPKLVELEARAAASVPALRHAVRREGSRIRGEQPRRRGRFAHALEEWLMPCIGLAGLLFGAFMTAPASWFGATAEYRFDSGATTEYENVNFSNVETRFWISVVVGVIAGLMVLANIFMRSARGQWTATTQGAGMLFSILASVNVVFLIVNIGDGFAQLRAALWTHVLTLALSALMAVLAFALYRRGRHYGARDAFMRLPEGQRQMILADRAAAVQVLADRQIIGRARARGLAKRPFGKITANAHATAEV